MVERGRVVVAAEAGAAAAATAVGAGAHTACTASGTGAQRGTRSAREKGGVEGDWLETVGRGGGG